MKKILYLTWKVVCGQFTAIFLSFMFMLMFGSLSGKMGITEICLAFIWFATIYSVGWNTGNKDTRKIKGVEPDIKSNFLAGLLCSLVTLFLLTIRIGAFHFLAGGNVLNKPLLLVVADVIYRVWNFPYVSYIKSATLLAYFVPVFFHIILYPAAYLLGIKGFRFKEKILDRILYKKEI